MLLPSLKSLRASRTDSLVGCEERSFDSSAAADSLPEKLGAGRINIPVRCEERSFVAMLLRTDSLVGCEERSFDSLRSLRIRILIGCVVNNNTPLPPVFL